jgi:acyl-CoA-binding protein
VPRQSFRRWRGDHPMSELNAHFENAVPRAKSLARQPSTDSLLLLHAYYMQATVGGLTGDRPGITDLRGRANYYASPAQGGLPANAAKEAYLALANRPEQRS